MAEKKGKRQEVDEETEVARLEACRSGRALAAQHPEDR